MFKNPTLKVLKDSGLPGPRMATACEHHDRVAKAKDMCASCYRAALRAEQLAADIHRRQTERSTERAIVAAETEFDKDPKLKAEFGEIMWSWLRESKVDEVWVERDGKRVRDWATEIRLREVAARAADKAATVLGRVYAAERAPDPVAPKPLPLGGEVDTSGWAAAVSDETEAEDSPVTGGTEENDDEE